MERAIYFDMDGTIADLYGCDGWLADLTAKRSKPYRNAKPLVSMRKLAREIKRLQKLGYHVGIVSWLSKSGDDDYNVKVTKAKTDWLARHIGSVEWDEVEIVPYGTPKASVVNFPSGILFDDEQPNRFAWMAATTKGMAFDQSHILEILAALQ